jgi:Flp pilus assembly secretin CpaC
MGVHISKLCQRGLGALSIGLALVVSVPALAVDTVTVTVDQAKIVQIPPGTRTLIIGNPMIADVTLLKSGSTMIVTGKGFGETNMIALDSNGSPLAESNILVVGDPRGLVVQRGMERESYTCAPRCQPTAVLGDNSAFFNNVASQIQAHNSDALGK